MHRQLIDEGMPSVIFGLASFAEGVDLPEHYCRHVVIAKLPFALPDGPVEKTYAEWVEAQGGDAFMDIAVPAASLKLVQATGRLLCKEFDEGRVTVLDARLLDTRYGRRMLEALPQFRVGPEAA